MDRANSGVAIVWFQRDLRLTDNPAFYAACRSGKAVVPIFIWPGAKHSESQNVSHESWAPGTASRWWLHHSLKSFENNLSKLGLRLALQVGDPKQILLNLSKQLRATDIFWNRVYEPSSASAEQEICGELEDIGVTVHRFNGSLLVEPAQFLNRSKKPYRVFTPYWRELQREFKERKILPRPVSAKRYGGLVASVRLDALRLSQFGSGKKVDRLVGVQGSWTPGEEGARYQLKRFVKGAASEYLVGRDRPDWEGTSRLSPHLHFGEISPNQIWAEISKARSKKSGGIKSTAVTGFLRQIVWREFAAHLLNHFPSTVTEPMDPKFKNFPPAKYRISSTSERGADSVRRNLTAWQRGETGYPIVDAGMRELWHTGWMHNRVRMIVGSFLVKDLLIPWQEGARWFWEALVDSDLANNTMGWQWIAGCGADAAPFFRIFNPVLQGEKFDPDGKYVRRWVSELAALPNKWIHKPWNAPAEILSKAGVMLGKNYPKPLADHSEARDRALELYQRL